MDGQPHDPNEEHDREIAAGKDHKPISEADAWGTKLNPVRDPGLPATGFHDGPSGASK